MGLAARSRLPCANDYLLRQVQKCGVHGDASLIPIILQGPRQQRVSISDLFGEPTNKSNVERKPSRRSGRGDDGQGDGWGWRLRGRRGRWLAGGSMRALCRLFSVKRALYLEGKPWQSIVHVVVRVYIYDRCRRDSSLEMMRTCADNIYTLDKVVSRVSLPP